MRRVLRRGLRGLTLVAVGYVAMLGLLMLFEQRLIFFPSRHPEGNWDAPSPSGSLHEDVWISTEDGVRIHGWWLPAPETAERTILFFHGNAGNLTGRFAWMQALTTLPANVLIIDYRGYGRSQGAPSEEGVYRDAEAAWEHLTKVRGIAPSDLVVYGNSLGGGVASALASERECGALILASTFTSIPEMARHQMPFVPAAMVRTQMNTRLRLPQIDVPVLIIHSRGDSMIPVEMARQNHAAANEPRRLLEVDRADHNEVTTIHRDRLLQAIRAFLDGTASEQ